MRPIRATAAPRPAGTPAPGQNCFGPPAAELLGSPTVLLFLAALLVCAAGLVGYFAGVLGTAAVVAVDSLGLYLGFTVLHDAVHGVAHKRPWAGRLLGTVTGFLLTFTYPFFRAVHLRHHAHANDPDHDPDAVTAGLSPQLAPAVGGMAVYLSYHYNFFRRRMWRTRAEFIEVVACDAFYVGILIAAIAGGWLPQLLALWVGPLFLTLHFLVYTFDYLPHYPHDSTERLYSARAYGGPLAAVVHLNQNFHLIHHLWPRIPWFRYRRVYLETRPALAARGCRVSFRVTPLPAADVRSGARAEVADRQVRGDLAGEAGEGDAARPDRRLAAGVQAGDAPPPTEERQRHLGQIPTEAGRGAQGGAGETLRRQRRAYVGVDHRRRGTR
jgi:beta-carotene hydroxylase